MVAHWKLDETTGAAAADELGNSDGTRMNMTDGLIVDGLDGKAVDFASGDDTSYITVPHNDIIDFDSTEAFSVSALMYIPEAPEGGYNALIKGNTGVDPSIGAEGKWYTIE